MKIKRPSFDEYFIQIAELVSIRSSCLSRRVGAILVRDNKILSAGYNGAPSGIQHCDKAGCLRAKLKIESGKNHELCRGLHAEQNTLLQAALHGINVKGSTLYTTTYPCIICAKMLINAGIKDVRYLNEYPDTMSKRFFKEAGIIVKRVDWGTKCH